MTPAIAAAALVAVAALQIGWSRPIALPPPDVITPVRLEPAIPLPVRAPAAGPSLFAAAASALSEGGALPLDGARAIGMASRGGRALAFVQAADGRVISLAPGQFFAGWQLVGVGPDRLRFRRGGEAASLALGAGPAGAAR